MYKIKNSNIPFVTLSKENMFTICNSLEYDEIGLIFKAFMDFVYFGIEPTFEKKYMQGIFDGVLQTMERKAEGCFASRENGKKGGRKPKNNTELQPNTEFDTEAKISPNEPCLAINDTDVPQEAESVSEGPKQAEFDNSIEVFEKAYSDKLINFIDKYSLKIEFIIETLSKYNINPSSVDYRTLETEKDRMRKMINYLGGNTKDARDLEDFFNKRIDEAIANIVLNEVRR